MQSLTRCSSLVWYTHSNTCFQFLNNITRISTHFFTYTYFHTCFQFLSACTKHPLSFQKSASDQTSLGYDFSFSNIASSSTIVFVSLANNVESENTDVKTILASENIDKGKFILGALPKLDNKEIKNPRANKGNSQKPKQKKQHLCHHCGAAGHTRPNCYKWLAT